MKVSSTLWAVVGLAMVGVATDAAARETAAQKYAQKRASAIANKYTVVVKGTSGTALAKGTEVAFAPIAYQEAKPAQAVSKPVEAGNDSVFAFDTSSIRLMSASRSNTNTPTNPSSSYNYVARPGADGTDGFSRSNPPGPGDRPSVFSNWVWTGTGWVWGGDLPCSNGGHGGISPC